MKKKGYYEYENGIYPQKLWVHIGKDLPELINAEFEVVIHKMTDIVALLTTKLSERVMTDMEF